MSQVSLRRPEFVPGTPPGHPTAKFLYVIYLYRFFSLHIFCIFGTFQEGLSSTWEKRRKTAFFLRCPPTSSNLHWQAPKSTRKRNTRENAGSRPFPESAFSGVLRFRVCFGALLEGNKEHPKTQHTRKRRFWERSITCVFGCVAFSGAFCSPLTPSLKLPFAALQPRRALNPLFPALQKVSVNLLYLALRNGGRHFRGNRAREVFSEVPKRGWTKRERKVSQTLA